MAQTIMIDHFVITVIRLQSTCDSKPQNSLVITRRQMITKLLLCLLLITVSLCGTAQQWKSRSIYQLLTDRFARTDGSTSGCGNLGNYCGGTYRGIINHLDYIQGMGFDAIWISPIIDNYDGGYHGYWGRDIYSLNSKFGSESDLVELITKCHSRGIWVMVDVVANHMGNTDQHYGSNKLFTDASNYHDYCIISNSDFQNHNQDRIENCRLAGLADLKQQNDYVRTTLLSWIYFIVNKYKIDGLRVDTVPEVPKWFWQQFTNSAGVFTIGEVFDGGMKYVSGYVGYVSSTLNYPFYFWFKDTLFNKKDMNNIRLYYNSWAGNMSSSNLKYMGNFIDNHDNARTLHGGGDWETKKKLYKTAHVFVLTSVGIPIVYYGAEQYYAGGDDPNNRETLWTNLNKNSDMYLYIATINAARKKMQIWNYDQVERYVDNQLFAFSRGKMFVATTSETSKEVTKRISYHPFSTGEVVCNIFYPQQDCLTVTSSGFDVHLLSGEAKIYIPR